MPKVPVPKLSDTAIIKKRRIEALKRIQRGESRRKVVAQRLGTFSSISRSIHSLVKGYNVAEPGHRQKMNTQDEANLEGWILELVKRGETVFASTVIKMVSTIIIIDFCSAFSLV